MSWRGLRSISCLVAVTTAFSAFERLRSALAQGLYVMGDVFTSADVLIGSALAFGRHAFPADEVLDAYVERCRSRPAAIRGVALDEKSGLQAVT